MGFTKQHGKNLQRKMNHYSIHRGLIVASWISIHSLTERFKGKERQGKINKRRYRYSVNNRLEGWRNNDRKQKREEKKGGKKEKEVTERKRGNASTNETLRRVRGILHDYPEINPHLYAAILFRSSTVISASLVPLTSHKRTGINNNVPTEIPNTPILRMYKNNVNGSL
jgi:hypothetical protein